MKKFESIDGQNLQSIGDIVPTDFHYDDALARQFEAVGEIGYFIFDAITERFLYVSSGFARIYGVCPKAHLGTIQSLDDDLALIVEEDRERVHAAYQKYLCRGVNCVVQYRIHRADGEIRWLRESSSAQRINNGKVELTIGAIQDITEQKIIEHELVKAKQELEETVTERTAQLADVVKSLQSEVRERERIAGELEFLANHDALTGLPSMRLCKDRLEQALAESKRNDHNTAVMFLDLDGFKKLNDDYGHEFGDRALRAIADRLSQGIRETDTVARIGGDEFLVILPSVTDEKVVSRIAGQLNAQVAGLTLIDQCEVSVGVSIGIALYPRDGVTPEDLIRKADKAMYRIKHSGKNSFGFAGRDGEG